MPAYLAASIFNREKYLVSGQNVFVSNSLRSCLAQLDFQDMSFHLRCKHALLLTAVRAIVQPVNKQKKECIDFIKIAACLS